MAPCCDDPQVTWDDDICMNVCTSCGFTIDNVLSSGSTTVDLTGTQCVTGRVTSITTLNNRKFRIDDTAERKEDRNKPETASMHQFINALCLQMSQQGLSERVRILFDQAMTACKFRWGGKAKAAAGACLAIALRERKKADRTKEIALLLRQKHVYLLRTLSTILQSRSTNGYIRPPQITPSHHVEDIQSHLALELQKPAEESELNLKLYSQLQGISLHAAALLALQLLDALTNSSMSKLLEASPAATACAAFVLCLEGEFGHSLFQIKDLFKCLAQQCHRSREHVCRPYSGMRKEVFKWMDELSWMDQYKQDRNGKAEGSSKRNLCARGLKDTLALKDKLWRKKQLTEGEKRVFLVEKNPDAEDSGAESNDEEPRLIQRVKQENDDDDENLVTEPPVVAFEPKNKKADRFILNGVRFLYNPFYDLPKGVSVPKKFPRTNWLTASNSSSQHTPLQLPTSPLKDSILINSQSSATAAPASATHSVSKSKSAAKVASMLKAKSTASSKDFHKALNSAYQFPTNPLPCDYMNYLISSDEPVSVIRARIHEMATRMALRTASRGAADADAVPDDELLPEEEWDLLQRTEEEKDQLQQYWRKVPGLIESMEKNAERAQKRGEEQEQREKNENDAKYGNEEEKGKGNGKKTAPKKRKRAEANITAAKGRKRVKGTKEVKYEEDTVNYEEDTDDTSSDDDDDFDEGVEAGGIRRILKFAVKELGSDINPDSAQFLDVVGTGFDFACFDD